MKVNERMDPYFQALADGIDSPVMLLNKHNELIYLNELSKEMGLNSYKVLKKIQNGEAKYHMIEIMACPGGCIGGGGQPYIHGDTSILKKRIEALYKEDENKY